MGNGSSAWSAISYFADASDFDTTAIESTIDSKVATAVNNLVAGAPAALNTLNELAVAINSDSSFASTITNALSQKAGVDSVTNHTSATTSVHGIADTAALATQTFVNTAATAAQNAASSDATTKANAAENAAKAYTDARETAITTAYQSYADTAESDAKAYADEKIADLVDSAPALLDTLNELAAAIGDDANFAANLATSVGEKVAKAGDTMTGALVLHADPVNNLEAATKAYVDTTASTAQSNAEDYADGLASNYDAAGSASAAQTAAEGYASGLDSATNTRIDNLTTSNVAEGSNEYFTSSRAKTAAAELLTGATLSNITITGTGAGLTITAENGVAQSTTDDLNEGTSNLYFTNTRAVDALEAVVPNFTAVELNSVAKQVAATASIATASTNTAVSWLKAEYRSAEFLVKIANGSHTDVSKVILTLDTSDNVAITEYAMVGTNGSLGSVSADVSGNDVRLRVTTANNTSTVAVIGTLLA